MQTSSSEGEVKATPSRPALFLPHSWCFIKTLRVNNSHPNGWTRSSGKSPYVIIDNPKAGTRFVRLILAPWSNQLFCWHTKQTLIAMNIPTAWENSISPDSLARREAFRECARQDNARTDITKHLRMKKAHTTHGGKAQKLPGWCGKEENASSGWKLDRNSIVTEALFLVSLWELTNNRLEGWGERIARVIALSEMSWRLLIKKRFCSVLWRNSSLSLRFESRLFPRWLRRMTSVMFRNSSMAHSGIEFLFTACDLFSCFNPTRILVRHETCCSTQAPLSSREYSCCASNFCGS